MNTLAYLRALASVVLLLCLGSPYAQAQHTPRVEDKPVRVILNDGSKLSRFQ